MERGEAVSKSKPRFALGYIQDRADARDKVFSVGAPRAFPSKVSRRGLPGYPVIWNQGHLGSCVGHGVVYGLLMAQLKSGLITPAMLSRLMAYWGGRVAIGTTAEDSGCMIRDCVKFAVKSGVCIELLWPYIEAKVFERPPDPCWQNALLNQALVYERITPSLDAFKACLAGGGDIVFGMDIYASYQSETTMRTGNVRKPGRWFDRKLGGHCQAIIGYDDNRRKGDMEIRGSWSQDVGDAGHFWIPYDYLVSAARDCWTIKLAELGK